MYGRILDSKGRLFGVINLIDLMCLLMIAGFIWSWFIYYKACKAHTIIEETIPKSKTVILVNRLSGGVQVIAADSPYMEFRKADRELFDKLYEVIERGK
jgi:hypothetical protein